MKTHIESVEIYRVDMPLVTPFTTAYGSDNTIGSVLLRMRGGGAEGWGETSPLQFPTYSPEWAGGVFVTLRDVLAPRIVGQSIERGADIQRLLAPFKQNPFAKAALDLAWWDLEARLREVPLWRLIGGTNPTIQVGADFGVQKSFDVLLQKIGTAVDDGFKRVKLKFRRGWDVDMIAAVRDSFPDTVFHIDCNSSFTPDDRSMFMSLDRYNLAMIEQPLAHDDLIDHAELQNAVDTPICLDESINSVERARKAIRIGACRWINLKPGRAGGLTPVLQIHDMCEKNGIKCWVGSMLESAVGASFLKALSTLSNIAYPNDIFPSSRFYVDDLGTPEIELSGPSEMTLFEEPGCGASPKPELLERYTVERAVVRP